ncbi:MAG: hypothetical protein ABW190_06600 [Rhizobacter sp.]
MYESEKLAIAAHLHVMMRRKIGRVTDVEWITKNLDYAREVIRVARSEPHPELHEWAAKLEAALMPAVRPAVSAPMPLDAAGPAQAKRERYVGRLR